MVILIKGASHAGKTALAKKLVIKYGYSCLSIDHLKMGLIRSGQTTLTPMSSDDDLTAYLWPIVREMVKTAIENRQDLIVEGCYIPFGWEADFTESYLSHIRCICLIMSRRYIENHFDEIAFYANVAEARLCDDCSREMLLQDNTLLLQQAKATGSAYTLIDTDYEADMKELEHIL